MTRQVLGPIAIAAVVLIAMAVWMKLDARRATDGPSTSHDPAMAPPPLPPVERNRNGSNEDARRASRELNLRLLATTVSSTALERSRAHIQDLGRTSRYVVSEGDTLPGYGDLEVLEIRPGRVALQYGDEWIELVLDPGHPWPDDPQQRPVPVTLTDVVDALSVQGADESDVEYEARLKYGVGLLYRRDLGMRDDDALFKHGVFAPKKRDGKQIGYYASRINKGSFWDTLGVRAGDVVVAVNGIAIDGSDDIREQVGEFIRSATDIQLTVERDGAVFETSTVTVPVTTGAWTLPEAASAE